MRDGVSSGVHFGLTSGVITTLGLIVGLHSGTHSALAVIGGIVTIAIADALSDALGIHIAKEAERRYSVRHVWQATLATFVAKFAMASTFVVPVLLLPLEVAILASVAWGLLVIALLSLMMARSRGVRPWPVVVEHVGIALLVVVVTHFVGDAVGRIFGSPGVGA